MVYVHVLHFGCLYIENKYPLKKAATCSCIKLHVENWLCYNVLMRPTCICVCTCNQADTVLLKVAHSGTT